MPDRFTTPLLTTERLILRLPEERDLDAVAATMADAETMRFTNHGQPIDRAESWRRIATQLGHWQLRGYGPFAVEEKATGRWVGRVGPWRPEGWPGLELIWTIARPCWGRGYASEAAIAARAWTVSTLGANRLISLIDPSNAGSRGVARKLCCRRGGAMPFFGTTVEIWHHDTAASAAGR